MSERAPILPPANPAAKPFEIPKAPKMPTFGGSNPMDAPFGLENNKAPVNSVGQTGHPVAHGNDAADPLGRTGFPSLPASAVMGNYRD